VIDPVVPYSGVFCEVAAMLRWHGSLQSSHHWSRELQGLGHTVRLMPPAYVKPYVKRQKNDATDAEAICEAVTGPNMRFVPPKTPEQQGCLTLHRTRHLFIRHPHRPLLEPSGPVQLAAACRILALLGHADRRSACSLSELKRSSANKLASSRLLDC
jgi:hypothetical protein